MWKEKDYLELFNRFNQQKDSSFELLELNLKEKYIKYKHLECGTVLKKSLSLFHTRHGCNNKDCIVKTRNKKMLEKYGVENTFQSKEIKDKIKQTNLKKYKVDNPAKNKDIYKKIKQTNLKKYGFKNPMQNKNIYNKMLKTKEKKYGDCNYNNKKKAVKTNLKKYGVEHTMQNKDVKKLREENNLRKYGTKQTASLKLTINKREKTCLKKYGIKNISQLDNTIKKIYNTKKKNKTFNTSKKEEKLYEILSKYFEVKRYYKEKRYPFSCDFYLLEFDLFIEYQGSWVHGNEVFNSKNEKHLEKLNEWKKRSKEINFKGEKKSYYNHAINVWSKIDPKKRKIVKKNNLNYLEIFKFKDELDILNQIKKGIIA